jgi:hypothetical protein
MACVLIPDTIYSMPSEIRDELLGAVFLILSKPWGTHNEPLKAVGTSWKQSAESWSQNSPSPLRETFQEFYGNRANLNVKCRREHHSESDIVPIMWAEMIQEFDIELAKHLYGREDGCWGCGREMTEKKSCSKCHRARYCSVVCQKRAYWHHKISKDSDTGCELAGRE